MPPKTDKAKSNKPSKKTEQKKKEKLIEDKTFGLKNKNKSAKQQKYIQQVQNQVMHGGNKISRQQDKDREENKAKKDQKKKDLEEICEILKPVQQIVGKGVDPKSVLCEAFKAGVCLKGDKCKFSHVRNIAKKNEKRSIYVDLREEFDEESEGNPGEPRPITKKVCTYFVEAVEKGNFGWGWKCPNGESCHFTHAMPEDYVRPKDRSEAEKAIEITLEELIERERAALGPNTTRLTAETFLAWEVKKMNEETEVEAKDMARKKRDMKAGREGGLSGRDMFTIDPTLISHGDGDLDDDDATMDLSSLPQGDVEEVEDDPNEDQETPPVHFREIDLNSFGQKNINDIANKAPEGTTAASETAASEAVAIDEDLFACDDDFDDFEDDLDSLNMNS